MLQQTKLRATLLLAAFIYVYNPVSGFVPQLYQPIQLTQNINRQYIFIKPLPAGLDDNDNQVDNAPSDNFDGQGFANYLGPYALALVVSIIVTAAFVKFVLMDYWIFNYTIKRFSA